jgi:hypothetical protein
MPEHALPFTVLAVKQLFEKADGRCSSYLGGELFLLRLRCLRGQAGRRLERLELLRDPQSAEIYRVLDFKGMLQDRLKLLNPNGEIVVRVLSLLQAIFQVLLFGLPLGLLAILLHVTRELPLVSLSGLSRPLLLPQLTVVVRDSAPLGARCVASDGVH